MRMRLGVVASVVLVALGCSGGGSSGTSSSSSGSPSSSSGGSSGGSSGTPSTNDVCKFTGTLSGSVEGTITANGCGTGDSSSFSIAQADLIKGTSLGIRFRLVTALKGGELGAQELEALELFKIEGKDTPELVWQSKTCTIELTKNEHSPTTVFENRYVLEGKGSCPNPVDSLAPNARMPITVGTFQFGAFVDP